MTITIKIIWVLLNTVHGFEMDYLNKFRCTKGNVQLKLLVVFTIKTGGEGSGQLLTTLWFFNGGLANY